VLRASRVLLDIVFLAALDQEVRTAQICFCG
jgi:hypothetical protein